MMMKTPLLSDVNYKTLRMARLVSVVSENYENFDHCMMAIMMLMLKKLTLIQRQSDNGRVTRITMIETPVRKNAAGPGPSGSAERKMISCFF